MTFKTIAVAGSIRFTSVLMSCIALHGQLAHSDDGYVSLRGFSTEKVVELLECQVSRTWTKELLNKFSADADANGSTIIPVALFPVPVENDALDSLDALDFDQWCMQHIAAARSREGKLQSGISKLFPTESDYELSLLAKKLAACAQSSNVSLVMKLCATAAIANEEPRLVRDSLLTAVLVFANSEGKHSGIKIQTRASDLENDSGFVLDELIANIMDKLVSDPEAGVLIEYVSLVIKRKKNDILPELSRVSGRNFTAPFLTLQGSDERRFALNIDREPTLAFGDAEPRGLMTGEVVVSEARVLASYRANDMASAPGKVVYTIARFEMSKFFELLSDRINSELKDGQVIKGTIADQVDLAVARFLQIDDWSSIVQMLRLIERLEDHMVNEEGERGDDRELTMDALRRIVREKAAQPREAFGVSVVDLYGAMLELRGRANGWEASLRRSNK